MTEARTDKIWRVGNDLVDQLSAAQKNDLVDMLCKLQPEHSAVFRGFPNKPLGEVARGVLWNDEVLLEKASQGDLPSGEELSLLMKGQLTKSFQMKDNAPVMGRA